MTHPLPKEIIEHNVKGSIKHPMHARKAAKSKTTVGQFVRLTIRIFVWHKEIWSRNSLAALTFF